jgi:hypothetical protein
MVIQDCVHVNGVQSDSGGTEQAPTVTSGCRMFENEAVQKPVMFTSLEVKCEVEVSCFFLQKSHNFYKLAYELLPF